MVSAYALSGSFFFNDTATAEIYTLSLHDALPISLLRKRTDTVGELVGYAASAAKREMRVGASGRPANQAATRSRLRAAAVATRPEEHTSELQSRQYLVCRLLLEKKPLIPPHVLRV